MHGFEVCMVGGLYEVKKKNPPGKNEDKSCMMVMRSAMNVETEKRKILWTNITNTVATRVS